MSAVEQHDMDTVPCPQCGGDTVRGLVAAGKYCGRCLKARHPKFAEFRARVFAQRPGVEAAYRRSRLRHLTEGLDKRQARRVRRRYWKAAER